MAFFSTLVLRIQRDVVILLCRLSHVWAVRRIVNVKLAAHIHNTQSVHNTASSALLTPPCQHQTTPRQSTQGTACLTFITDKRSSNLLPVTRSHYWETAWFSSASPRNFKSHYLKFGHDLFKYIFPVHHSVILLTLDSIQRI